MADEIQVVTMPKLGETVTEGTISSWLKQVGDTVEFDDPLFEVSTDKVDSEFPSPADGVILEILVGADQTVPVGTELARIGPPGSTPGASAPASGGAASETASAGVASGGPTPEAGAHQDGQSGFAEGSGAVYDVTMPKLGETVTEGTISSWLKKVGDKIEFDDPLFEVSTDKVDSEFPSPYDGVLLDILVEADQTVPVGTVLAHIGDPSVGPTEHTGGLAPTPQKGGSAQPARISGIKETPAAVPGKTYSPIVRRLASENGIDLSTLSGTGEGGRIRREDVEAVIAQVPAAGQTTAPVAAAPAPAASTGAAPASGMGPRQDAPPVPGVPDDRDEIKPLSKMRLAVGAGMIRSLQTAPQVWTSIEVDWHNVEQTRTRHKAQYKKQTGASLSYLTFAAKAVAESLLKFPAVNSSIDMSTKSQIFHPYVNLGIAVDLDEQGLIVPVIKDADQLNLRGLGTNIKGQAEKGRNRRLGSDEMKGSTFSITNVGPFQSYASSPIINQPNVGILCLDGVARRPVAVGDMIAIHPTGIVGLVYDHRAFDGATASKFLLSVRDILQDRDWDAELGF